MRRPKPAMAALLAAVLLACGGFGSPAASQEPVVLDAGRRAALAALPALRGPAARAEALANRVVVVTFFASWCPPCHAEFDELARIHARYGPRGLRIVAVNLFEDYIRDDGARLEAFLTAKAPPFLVLGAGEELQESFGRVERIPTLFVFGRDGRQLLHFVHARGASKTHVSFAEIAAAIERAL